MDEIALLLDKIRTSEDFIERAEIYFSEHSHAWSDGVAAHFEIYLERKRDQVYYERERLERMGWTAALDRHYSGPDI